MWNISISLWEVRKATDRLLNRKAPGVDGILVEHIKYGGMILLIHMGVLFQAMLRHSFIPEQFKDSIVVPIMKDRNGGVSDPDNYRGISLSSVVSKLYERLILVKYGMGTYWSPVTLSLVLSHMLAVLSALLSYKRQLTIIYQMELTEFTCVPWICPKLLTEYHIINCCASY